MTAIIICLLAKAFMRGCLRSTCRAVEWTLRPSTSCLRWREKEIVILVGDVRAF